MRAISRLILMITVFSISVILISACQRDGMDGGKESKEGNEISKEDSRTSKKNSEDNQGVSNNEYEKLDISPKVSINDMDYITIDKPSVDFDLEDLNGNSIKLSDYKGQIVFLNFWATWCPPCRAEMPDMESIHQQYKDKGVALLGVNSTGAELQWRGKNSEKAKEQVKEFIDKEGYTFTIPLDIDDKVYEDYSKLYPINGIPTTFMIDREGIIRYVRPGAFQGEEQLEAFIALLDE